MKSSAVESYVEAVGEELEDLLDDVLASRCVDSDDLVGSRLLDGEVDPILGESEKESKESKEERCELDGKGGGLDDASRLNSPEANRR